MADLRSQLDAIRARTETKMDAVVRESVGDIGQSIVDLTPRDTGKLGSNWNYGLLVPDTRVSAATDVRTVNHLDEMPREAAKYKHTITNSVPYAYWVEVGTSRMAPRAMVGQTVLRAVEIIGAAVRRVTGEAI